MSCGSCVREKGMDASVATLFFLSLFPLFRLLPFGLSRFFLLFFPFFEWSTILSQLQKIHEGTHKDEIPNKNYSSLSQPQ